MNNIAVCVAFPGVGTNDVADAIVMYNVQVIDTLVFDAMIDYALYRQHLAERGIDVMIFIFEPGDFVKVSCDADLSSLVVKIQSICY